MKPRRKAWFRFLKKIMRIFIKKTDFVYLGEEICDGSIILSNHVGTAAPLAWELYGNVNFRFWGAHEMNSGLRSLYRYQTRVFYHEKKHWNLYLARLFCLIASPLTVLFYKGLNLISIYSDVRFTKTLRESVSTLENKESIVIFPEDSTKGYLDVLDGFHAGFTLLAERCLKKGMDVPIYVAYYQKESKTYLVDKPVMLSELFAHGGDRFAIARGVGNTEELLAAVIAECSSAAAACGVKPGMTGREALLLMEKA